MLNSINNKIRENILVISRATILTVLLFSGICMSWFFLTDGMKRKSGNKYLSEISKCNNLSQKECQSMIENAFENCKDPLYKTFYGLQILKSARNIKNKNEQIEIISKIVKIKGLPIQFKHILEIELGNLLLEKENNLDQKIIRRLSRIKENDSMWIIANEVLLGSMIKKENLTGARNKAQLILRHAKDKTATRISAVLYSLDLNSVN